MSYGAEKGLAYLYPTVILTSAICCITSGVAWAHWRYVLNACPETNCGCVLHGRSTYVSFEGGHIAYCHFATYGLILPLLFAIVLAPLITVRIYVFIMFTAFAWEPLKESLAQQRFVKGNYNMRIKNGRSGDMIVVTTESELSDNGISPYYWIPALTTAAIMALYTLVYASVFTDGFEVTCKQYREALLKEIQGVGNIVPVIKGRLSCAAVFDFMDYLVDSVSWERRRYGRINAAACLYMALISAWIAVFDWIGIIIINTVQMKRTRAARV